ncbi:MAG: hypothetical protein Q3M30_02980 [Candidatus Electrothrix sp. Rat3]|nr:hypothetical protein [Candidatus Electrothrix rattekaaiensis]
MARKKSFFPDAEWSVPIAASRRGRKNNKVVLLDDFSVLLHGFSLLLGHFSALLYDFTVPLCHFFGLFGRFSPLLCGFALLFRHFSRLRNRKNTGRSLFSLRIHLPAQQLLGEKRQKNKITVRRAPAAPH